jgi:hypothetical protein
MIVYYVSYVPRLRSWSARDGQEITAPSLPELRALLAEAHGGAAVRLHLSRGARAELLRRKTGAVAQIGWT